MCTFKMKYYVIKWITPFILYSLTVLICLKNGEFVIFVFRKVRLKPRYFKYSWCDFYGNWRVLPGNLVPTYSSVVVCLFFIWKSNYQENTKTKV